MAAHLRLFRATAAILAALALSATALSGQAPESASNADRGLIWRFEREGRTGWLVGSLHMMTPDFYPLPASLTKAFESSDTLVEEIDMAEANSPAFLATVLSKAMYPAGTTLSTQLSKETLDSLNASLARSGLAITPFQQMKPWMVALMLQALALQRLGFDPNLGLDRHFSVAAEKAGKPLVPLETGAEQIGFLDGLSARTQDLMLRESIQATETELAEVRALAAAWRAGDSATIERIAVSTVADAPEVYKVLLSDRNHRWIPKIEGCVEKRRCFIVVGAAHLVGPDGLVVLLRKRGYTLQQQ
jgi:uncharacterized protein YbaP (TraB family)